jgi:Chlorophyll A-B binding protein
MLKLHDLAPGVFPHPKWLRECELKHCRIAMLASVGAFTAQYGIVLPGYTAAADPVTNLNSFVLDWPLGFTQVYTSFRHDFKSL